MATSKSTVIRNGEDEKGWALRLYGDHSDLTFTGTVHGGVRQNFFHNWV